MHRFRQQLPGFALALALAAATARAGDQPQFGQAWSRNPVSAERGLPADFDPATGRHVRWTADLGTETYATPTIARGRVYIGTNNNRPRDARHRGDRGVLLCLDEATGRLLWQLIVPKRTGDIYLDWPNSGICSPPTIEGDRVYLVSNRGEVLCLDAHGLANGNQGPFTDEPRHNTPADQPDPIPLGPTDADILWRFDLTAGAGIWSHDAAHSSILIHGDFLWLNTGTGVDNTHRRIRTPEAPALVVLDKRIGRLAARDRESIAPGTFHCNWSSPSLAMVDGAPRLFFAGGNGVVYAFALPGAGRLEGGDSPAGLERLWRFEFDPEAPRTNIHEFIGNRRESPSVLYAMPVFDNNRLYVAGGGDLWWGKRQSWLRCLRAGGPAPELAWTAPLRDHVMATPAIAHGLVFIGDTSGRLHCLDAGTGAEVWTEDLGGEVWASPLLADGRVYVGTRRGVFHILAAARQKESLGVVRGLPPISASATAANGVLYVATAKTLYALSRPSGTP